MHIPLYMHVSGQQLKYHIGLLVFTTISSPLSSSLPPLSLSSLQWVKIQPTGLVHYKTKQNGHHYSWNKPHTTVHNLIFGQLWADHEGDVVVNSHQTGDKAVVTWTPYSKAKSRYRSLVGMYSVCKHTLWCVPSSSTPDSSTPNSSTQ